MLDVKGDLVVKGGCACGSVRYESPERPQFAFQCQCRSCQWASGTGHASQIVVQAGSLVVTGELSFYESKSDSGNTVSRGFCPQCGSPILNTTSGCPDIRVIHVASLDDPKGFKPQKVAYHLDAQPWDYVDPRLVPGDQADNKK